MFSACENTSKTVKPFRLLTEQEMIAIMYDMQILEADMNYRKSKDKMTDEMPKEYYSQLFEHYGITDSIFDENLHYYTHDPALMERVMDSVTQRLTKIQTTSSAQQQSNH